MRDLTVDLLNHLFEYDKETGNLIWKIQNQGARKGSIAGTLRPDGYYQIAINKKLYLTHRLVFLMHKGYLPEILDHINNDAGDNRIENLRAASRSQNAYNSKLASNNKSGYKGVFWLKKNKKWRASITFNKKAIHLGCFDNVEEAAEVVRKAREELHGDFAHHGDDND
jgi:hypothetical protein